jgi:hypothetical protein
VNLISTGEPTASVIGDEADKAISASAQRINKAARAIFENSAAVLKRSSVTDPS